MSRRIEVELTSARDDSSWTWRAASAPKQEKKRNEAERIEIIGQPRRDDQLVTSTLTSRPKGERRDSRDRGDRSDRSDRPGRPARSGRPPRKPGDGDAGRPKDRPD